MPVDILLPIELRPECESLPDPIIVATRRVEKPQDGVMYDVKVGNTGGTTASIVVRQTDHDGNVVDGAPVQVAPLATSEWLLKGCPYYGSKQPRLRLPAKIAQTRFTCS